MLATAPVSAAPPAGDNTLAFSEMAAGWELTLIAGSASGSVRSAAGFSRTRTTVLSAPDRSVPVMGSFRAKGKDD